MTWSEIERRASELLVRVPVPPTGSPEVPVEAVARQLGLPVMKVDLGEDVSGILVNEGERSYIAVQQSEHVHRRRFSMAHEIGHYCLGHHQDEAVHVDQAPTITYRAVNRSTDPVSKRKESAANHFAACLLMPRDRVLDEVRKLAGTGPLTDMDVEELARRFKVSQVAMTYRLQFLRKL